ncbi:Glycosyltransferase involved in cell wall bisynthesis [Catalinimonas alkaloidigena]|uniref:Glycosyltransferase involved in cell wall bisynthesis n=1 Tax=Catalinimonas alkaloidigena TaxID=1075417 RepID=A0A1G9LES8_9BACT|nr:glycosyltransferase [Catalinimonas alkaloidigena]SDL60450.1 Glycosyltransferase involved in cell wall bisynthesis [Catalinimonas alkaloidigena]
MTLARVINLVDNVTPVNTGIWQAAIATAPRLKAHYGVTSELWFPDRDAFEPEQFPDTTAVPLASLQTKHALPTAQARGATPTDTLVVSHGNWHFPTRWGAALRQAGYAWVYVPHGMLEPWSLRQKRLKKWVYYRLFEERMLRQADAVRAVGGPERDNLLRRFPHVHLIPNGVPKLDGVSLQKPARRTVLFMARLHHKKGVVPLVEAWLQSPLHNHPDYRLVVAGPDDGELPRIKALLPPSDETNIEYVGAVFGEAKQRLLQESQFFALPSYSEGFPTTVPEVMQHGLIPLISKGCNFPEVFAVGLVIPAEPAVASIGQALHRLPEISEERREVWAKQARDFVWQHYTLQEIAAQQMALYTRLLTKN